MKFPVDKCVDCGLDLTTTEPTEVIYDPFEGKAFAPCPSCLRTYSMTEFTLPEPLLPVSEPVVEPEAEKPKKGKGKAEPVAEAEPEPEPEPAAEPEPEPEPEPEEE